ncbi:MAG: glycosyltransferase [Bacteroidetes bacterium]|nr:glycosyltransferase [Bacteroidota bacterium]
MNCSIIIRALNEERHIGRLLDGINRQLLANGVKPEVIVVDSGSTDSTISIAKNKGAKVITIQKEYFSFGRALNIGCKEAKGEILLFASAHVYPVYDNWIQKMIEPFTNDKTGLVYGRQIGNELTRFSEHEVFAKWFPDHDNPNQQTPFCNNANCSIRKSLWETQPYDEALTGLEDLDWAKRIMAKGYQISYRSDATIVHVHEETAQQIKNRYQREAIALKNIMPKVHFSFFDFTRLFVTNIFMDGFHALRRNKFLKEFKGIVIFRYMQFYGTYIGHNQNGEVSQELKNRFYYSNGFKRKKYSVNENENIIKYN